VNAETKLREACGMTDLSISLEDVCDEVSFSYSLLDEFLMSTHRWYQVWARVYRVDEGYFLIKFPECTGDASPHDMDITLKDRVHEMEPYEKTVTAYRRIKSD